MVNEWSHSQTLPSARKLAMRHGILPASLHVREPDAACRFDLIREPREARIPLALTNSFGFGGSNATLIFRNPN